MAFLKEDRKITINGVTVKEYFLTKHNPNKISLPSKRSKKLIGVTIHNTGVINAAKGTTMSEQYTRSTVNGNMNTVRVHFYVDHNEAWENLPLDYQSWHAGQRGKADRNGSEAGNAQTISIECIMSGSGSASDQKAEDNCARLAAYLLQSNGLTIENLYTHNYWCNVRNGRTGSVDYLNKTNDGYKNCPIYIRPHWDSFVNKVKGYMGVAVAQPDKSFYVRILDKSLNIRTAPGINSKVVGKITDCGIYTIVDTEKVGSIEWGKLKSGAGWISLNPKYVEKV